MSFNQCVFVGRVTHDFEIKEVVVNKETIPVSSFSVAINERSKESDPLYIDVSAWRRLAKLTASFLRKGSLVLVHGRLKKEAYQKAVSVNGETVNVPMISIRLLLDTFQCLEPKSEDPSETTREVDHA